MQTQTGYAQNKSVKMTNRFYKKYAAISGAQFQQDEHFKPAFE
jgi:hypothetical protein